MEGRKNADFKKLAAQANTTAKAFIPKGAETYEQVRRRAVKFFYGLCAALLLTKDGMDRKSAEEPRGNSDLVARESFEDSAASPVEDNQLANVLVISHGGLIKQMFNFLSTNVNSNLSSKLKHRTVKVPNTGVSIFHVYLDGRTQKPSYVDCRLVNDTSHLEGVGHVDRREESYAL